MLLDTSGLLCLYAQGEPFHTQAVQAYRSAQLRVTHSYILAEYVALATARRFSRLPVLEFLEDLMQNPDIDIVWVDEGLHRAAAALLLARIDKGYSLCDAVSFVVMQQRNLFEALTTDKHFEQAGFIRLLTI